MTSGAIAVCVEQTLGHRTHGQNLERAIWESHVDADVIRVEFDPNPRMLPWAIRGSRAVQQQLRSLARDHAVVFYHTQTISLLAPRLAPGTKYVVSVDATPTQLDTLGHWYEHRALPGPVEALKLRWYRHVFKHATSVVAWSEWAKQSLVSDYAVSEDRVMIAHPGAPDELFQLDRAEVAGTPRILFVGGDFRRKGGPELLDAFRALGDRAELVLMTEDESVYSPDVTVLRGVRPGTSAFLSAFREADIFCLPTHGDCTPVALGEAMAAGLPVVTTAVGSNKETVKEGTGLVVPPGDPAGLLAALDALIEAPERRKAMGIAARSHASAALSASQNAKRIVDHLSELAR